MSEAPTHPSTTKEDSGLAQKGIISLPDFNFSVNIDLHINIDPEIKALAELILSRLPGGNRQVSEIVTEALNTSTGGPEQDEPSELSVSIPEELIEPEKYGTLVKGPTWHEVGNSQWREEGNILFVKYESGVVETSWEEIFRLSKMPIRERGITLKEKLGDEWTKNKRSAVNQFIEKLESGEIKRVENPDAELENAFMQYQKESEVGACN